MPWLGWSIWHSCVTTRTTDRRVARKPTLHVGGVVTIAKSIGDIETDVYWSDVTSALVDICGLRRQDALAEVREARAALSSLSEWGQLLAHHDSVPQAAEDYLAAVLATQGLGTVNLRESDRSCLSGTQSVCDDEAFCRSASSYGRQHPVLALTDVWPCWSATGESSSVIKAVPFTRQPSRQPDGFPSTYRPISSV